VALADRARVRLRFGYAQAARPRRLTARRPDGQPKDDQADDSAILDQAWAAQEKRARRRPRRRGVLEVALDVLADVVGGLWP
jgi:hypothetical protein